MNNKRKILKKLKKKKENFGRIRVASRNIAHI
jgi:hypothetical protein